MEKSNYASGGILLGGILLYSKKIGAESKGIGAKTYLENPKMAYEKNIEGEKRQFLFVKSKGEKICIFVKKSYQEPYKKLYVVQRREKSGLEQETSKLEQELLKQ
jgi:hypothetical protein